ncbi:hypothetical protein EC957_011732 [Mortierella hygrophila]|uniref:3CxxC-type domain-containing protein n=1 Tax=Mortierella hygrophila TaxID=979708 RepID=A0A9P6F8W4_9FUNG|nr:hypothetical protein EC957_011732 [Mortierella hygrophila]
MTTDSTKAPPLIVKSQGATQIKDPMTPNKSRTPKAPKIPKAASSPKTASTPKESKVSNSPQASQAPKISKEPNESKESKEPKEPKEPKELNTPKPSNKPKKPKALKKPKTPKVKNENEMDAAEHHAALAEAPKGSQYKYDPNLTAERCRKHDVRNMSGRFVCSPCKFKKQHTWGSGVICTQLFLSRSNTYRAVFFGQQCKKCDKYGKLELDVGKYVERVLDTFELWRGLREARMPDPHVTTGPHDSRRCYGCQLGICNKRDDDEDDYNYDSDNGKNLRSFVRGRY